jgi:hypothetical protein
MYFVHMPKKVKKIRPVLCCPVFFLTFIEGVHYVEYLFFRSHICDIVISLPLCIPQFIYLSVS